MYNFARQEEHEARVRKRNVPFPFPARGYTFKQKKQMAPIFWLKNFMKFEKFG